MSDQLRTIRVLVIAAVRLYREGLADVLGRVPGVTVVGAEPDAHEAATRMGDWVPDVILLDIGAPQSQVVVLELAQHAPHVPVVALGVDRSEAEILACAEAGITGYVTAEASLEELVEVVETAARGEVICSPRLAGALVRRLATLATRNRATEASKPLRRLTPREREIVTFLERYRSGDREESRPQPAGQAERAPSRRSRPTR